MFARIYRFWNQFISQSRTINNEPLNKVSLIGIILIDIFIIINVFTGINDISRWYLSPSEAYPCYFEWENYRTQSIKDKNDNIISLSVQPDTTKPSNFRQAYQQVKEDRLGNISKTCLQYAEDKDKINNSPNRQIIKIISQKQNKISTLKKTNQNVRTQYDSTLLEKIAGQNREKSINQISAERARQELEQNNRQISTLQKEVTNLKNELNTRPESVNFITFLNNDGKFKDVEKNYKQALFWYPSIQLSFQAIFLLPLILVVLLIHNFAQRKRYGLISLISWHLLVIFFIPLILKLFEFLQIGAIFQVIFKVISALLGELLFLISYIYILLAPLVGYGIIKFFQKFVFNSKIQTANRVQTSSCIKCAKKIRHHDVYCPYCGYYQYSECHNCHTLTYKHLPYCKQCGYSQDISNL